MGDWLLFQYVGRPAPATSGLRRVLEHLTQAKIVILIGRVVSGENRTAQQSWLLPITASTPDRKSVYYSGFAVSDAIPKGFSRAMKKQRNVQIYIHITYIYIHTQHGRVFFFVCVCLSLCLCCSGSSSSSSSSSSSQSLTSVIKTPIIQPKRS